MLLCDEAFPMKQVIRCLPLLSPLLGGGVGGGVVSVIRGICSPPPTLLPRLFLAFIIEKPSELKQLATQWTEWQEVCFDASLRFSGCALLWYKHLHIANITFYFVLHWNGMAWMEKTYQVRSADCKLSKKTNLWTDLSGQTCSRPHLKLHKSFYFPTKLDSFLAPTPFSPPLRQLKQCLSDRCCMSDIAASHPDGWDPTDSGVGQTDSWTRSV